MDEYKYPAEKVADVMEEAKQQLFDTWNSQQANTQPNTGGEAWGGWYPPTEPKHVCPHCGYCPCCGRGGGFVPNYPLPYQPWPGYPNPYVGDWLNWQEWNKIICGPVYSTQPQGTNLQSYY